MEAPELVEKSQAEIAKNAWKERLKEEYAQLKAVSYTHLTLPTSDLV